MHALQVSDDVPKRVNGTDAIGTSTTYSRDDHQHILNKDVTVANKPVQDTGSGVKVNASTASNGTSDYYRRNDHVHPQQLTYDGNVTVTNFIKTE
ncbi:MAG: hypothetical protein EZS28_014041 [Streblomastix strix]|uniref:Uncharacterized protein n=1 Tax=Streblomastix strix TaxID=222440 RepID=A0A5J4W6X1_9EUKA|nr:MAG: hypothetical protein EZS28_014041 [Streblomastix strix]